MEPISPLRFEPIFRTALWGGRRLSALFPGAPSTGPISEAWVASDQDDNLSRVADGAWKGRTLRDLLGEHGQTILGRHAGQFARFPLLLKLIDAKQQLSVQVHPDDAQAKTLAGAANGKTEAWVILQADPGSRIFAGLKSGVKETVLRKALADGTIEGYLHEVAPKPGDCFFLPAGTVHALGGGVLLFELQQTSDVTYRLFDWGRVDPKTDKPRTLHVEEAIASADFASGPVVPIQKPVRQARGLLRDQLVSCPYFEIWRNHAASPFAIERSDRCRVLVGAEGLAYLVHDAVEYPLGVGQSVLLPAATSSCVCIPSGRSTILECAIP